MKLHKRTPSAIDEPRPWLKRIDGQTARCERCGEWGCPVYVDTNDKGYYTRCQRCGWWQMEERDDFNNR